MKNRKSLKFIIVMPLIFLSLFVAMVSISTASQESPSKNSLPSATAVWVQEENNSFELFFSIFQEDAWSRKAQLTNGDAINYVPSISSDSNNTTWIVWSAEFDGSIDLFFAIIENGVVMRPPEKIETSMNSNVGPYLSFDTNERPIIAWSGNDGSNDDIFYSNWGGSGWSKPKRVHPRNEVYDFLPRIYTDSAGSIVVEWSVVGPDGQFLMEKKLNSSKTQRMDYKKVSSAGRNAIEDRAKDCLPGLPKEIENPQLASMVFTCGTGRPSQQLQFLGKEFIQKQ